MAIFFVGIRKKGALVAHRVTLRVPKILKSQEYLVDGRLYISCYMASLLLGRLVLDGEGFTGHVNCPMGFFKGIIEARAEMVDDMWLYCGKKQLLSTPGTVTITLLSELHVNTPVYSDIQSVVALDYADQLPEFAVTAMLGFQDALNDDAKMDKR